VVDVFGASYWLNPDNGPANAYIVIDLGAAYHIVSIDLFNTHNSEFLTAAPVTSPSKQATRSPTLINRLGSGLKINGIDAVRVAARIRQESAERTAFVARLDR
jgi:hypothetical protein